MTDDVVDALADEFLRRHRAGDRPTIAEYLERCPEYADQIRNLFPALVMLEKLAGGDSVQDHSYSLLASIQRPDVLGDYRILQETGRGGMGIVYEAEQISLGRHVALKVLPFQLVSDDTAVERFHREARAAAKLQHPNIVPVYDFCQGESVWYYAMQFIHGQSLHDVLTELRRQKKRGVKQFESFDHLQLTNLATSLMTQTDWQELGEDADIDAALYAPTVDELPTDREEQIRHVVDKAMMESEQLDEATLIQEHPELMPELAEQLKMVQLIRGSRPPQMVEELTKLGEQHLPDEEPDTAAAPTETVSPTPPVSSTNKLTGSHKVGGSQAYFENTILLIGTVARALEYAHGEGVIHRDVKPSNLLLDTRGHIWITDFGLAKINRGDRTSTGSFAGTLRYMAPEQIRGHCDARSDVYSLGITLYEMLTLRPAFQGADYLELMTRICDDGPIPPRKVDPTISRDLETVVLTAIERNPDARYQDAKSFANDLQCIAMNQEISARRRNRLIRCWKFLCRNAAMSTLICALCVLIVVTSGALIAISNSRSDERRKNERGQTFYDHVIGVMSIQQALEKGNLDEAQLQLSNLDVQRSNPDPQPFEVQLMDARTRGDPYSWLELGPAPVTDVVALDPSGIAAISNRRPVLVDLRSDEIIQDEQAWADELRRTAEGPCWFGLHDGKLWLSMDPRKERQLCGLNGDENIQLTQATISNDLMWIATLDREGLVRIWERAGDGSLQFNPAQTAPLGRAENVRFAKSDMLKLPQLIMLKSEGISVRSVDGSTSIRVDHSKVVAFDLACKPVELAISDGRQLHIVPKSKLTLDVAPSVICSTMDGDRILIGALDGQVRMWHRRIGRPVLNLTRSDQPISAIDLSPSEAILVAGDHVGRVHVWHTRADQIGSHE